MRAAAAAVVKWQNGGQDYQGEALESTALSISGNIAIFFYVLLILKNGVCALFSGGPFYAHVFTSLFFILHYCGKAINGE